MHRVAIRVSIVFRMVTPAARRTLKFLGGGDSDLKPPDLNEFQASQQAQRLKAPALMKSRQDLCQDDIAYGHKFCLEQLIKIRPRRCRRRGRKQPRRSYRQASQFSPHRVQVSSPG